MSRALRLARQSARARAGRRKGEIPVGAILVRNGRVLAAAQSRTIRDRDPTAHAEILAIRAACRKVRNERLPGATMYTTLEPCPMCAAALAFARVERVVFGASNPLIGGCGSAWRLHRSRRLNHRYAVTSGVLRKECAELLLRFFRKLRVEKGSRRRNNRS